MACMKSTERRESIRLLLEERLEHGWTYKELSLRSGIPVPTLTGWAWRLRKEVARPSPRPEVVEFVELGVREEGGTTPSHIEVEVAGRYLVRVGPDFDEGVLGRLLRVLGA